MRRLLLSSLFVLLLSASAYGRERMYGICQLGNQTALVTTGLNTSPTTPLMRSYPKCTVTVYLTGTLTLATIFSDNSGTPKANPFVADSFGYWFFYADNGRYDAKLSGAGIPAPFTLSDLWLVDPGQITTGVSSITGTANQVCTNASTGAVTLSICSSPTLPGTTTGTFVGNLTGNVTGNLTGNASTSTAFDHTPTKCAAGSYTIGIDSGGNAQGCTVAGTGTGDVSSNTGVSVDGEDVQFSGTTGKLIKRATGNGVVSELAGVHQNTDTSTPLQYLRSKANLAGAPKTEFASLTYSVSSDFDFPPQTPGGTLTSGIGNTVILTPCPLGISGSALNTRLLIQNGVGTAESVLITGGTCTSGLTTGNVMFTPAFNHSGAWTIQSATSGIKEALNFIPADGGVVRMPCGPINLAATIVLGDGTPTTRSTRNSMSLVGCGGGRGVDTAFPATGATTLLWTGASGGTMIQVLGPVGNGTLSDFMLDGQGTAAQTLDLVHAYHWTFRNLTAVGWTSVGSRLVAVDFVFPGMVEGANKNLFENVFIGAGTGGGGSVACQFGQSVPNVSSIFDAAQNVMINSICRSDAGTGMELRLADNNTFYNTAIQGATGLKLTSPVAGFPGANVFVQSPLGGATPISTSAGFDLSTTNKNVFLPLSTTDAPVDPRTLVKFAIGFDFSGEWFGINKSLPLHYASSTSPAAIANTNAETAFNRHYLIPQNTLNFLGGVGRVKAAGRVSSTGTPTLTFQIKLGGVPIGKFTFTVGNNVTNDAFSMETDFTVDALGAGALLVGPSIGVMGGFSGASTIQANRVVGLQGITWTNDNDLTLTAQWSAASASNTVTLDGFTLDIEYPGHIQ